MKTGNHSKKIIVEVLLILSIFLFTLSLISLYMTDEIIIKDFGIFPILYDNITYLLALLVFIVSVILNIFFVHSKFMFAIQLVYIIFALFSPPIYIESLPRFRSTYFAYSFSDFIIRTGRVDPRYVFYHNWPFQPIFGATLYLVGLPTKSTQFMFLRTYPLLITLVYSSILYIILHRFGVNHKKIHVSTLVLPILNWVNQSYFCPQSVGFLFWLLIVYLFITTINKQVRTINGVTILLILIISIIATHLLSSLIIGGIILLNLVKNAFKTISTPKDDIKNFWLYLFVLFVSLSISWFLYFSYSYFKHNLPAVIANLYNVVHMLLESSLTPDNPVSSTLSRIQGSFAHIVVAKTMTIFAGISGILAVFGFVKKILFKRKLETIDTFLILHETSILFAIFVLGEYGILLG